MRELQACYPSPQEVLRILKKVPHDEQLGFVRLWLTEGIPFAFRNYPAMYEALRGWLALRLALNPKEITIIGSARIGFSLAPPPAFGKPYSDNSDLDLCVVSQARFHMLQREFEAWQRGFQNDRAHPRTDLERKLWISNLDVVPTGLSNGFIDPGKIPTWDPYPMAQRFGQTLYSLRHKFSITTSWPAVAKASIRVYQDWEVLIRRVLSNLRNAVEGIAG